VSIDIDRHISMIKSFRKTHLECADYVPYIIPNETYFTNSKQWVDLPVKELLLAEIPDDGIFSTENVATVRLTSDTTIVISLYTNAGGWQKVMSCVVKWVEQCVYSDIWFSPALFLTGLEAVTFQLGVIYGQLQFLSEPTVHADYIDPSPYAQKARADRGKKPLPAYRVIRPGQTVMHYRKGAAEGGNKIETDSGDTGEFKGRGKGVPKSPHWNHGSTYTKKNGRVVHKRPYPVKGGKCPDPLPVLALKPNEVRFVTD